MLWYVDAYKYNIYKFSIDIVFKPASNNTMDNIYTYFIKKKNNK